jgi:hypothetical protein
MTEIEFLTGAPSPVIRVNRSEKDPTIEGWSEPRVVIECDGESRAESVLQGISVSAEDSFVETFVRCERELNRMEKEIGPSSPTLRNRLQGIIRLLEYEPGAADVSGEDRRRVLGDMAAGHMNAQQHLHGR